MTETIAYIAVHGGAGLHGVNHEKDVKRVLRRACVNGLSVIASSSSSKGSDESPLAGSSSSSSSSSSSLAMVERAICVLEDDEHLNAGHGSNLTMDGTVECDASIMGARGGLFGSVGAVSGVRNPIRLAKSILDHSCVPNRFGRVPPLTLVSSGAHKFAASTAKPILETVPPDALITPRAHALWEKWKARLESPDILAESIQDEEGTSLKDLQDTVGAVAFHPGEGVAAGVSSGGLLMKCPGRVGEAAVFGAGCWASQSQKQGSEEFEGMACSVSGTGEYIIRENLARKLGEAFSPTSGENTDKDAHEILNHILHGFWDSCRERGEEEPAVGVILLTSEGESSASVRLWCGFTTATMAVGYASSKSGKPKAEIFRHPDFHKAGSGREGRPKIYITSIALT